MILFMVLGALIAVGLLHAYRLAVPPREDVAARVGQWDQARVRASRAQRIGTRTGSTGAQSPLERLVAWVVERIEHHQATHGPGTSSGGIAGLSRDLAITGTTLEAHLTKVLSLVGIGLLGPTVIFSVLDLSGLGVPPFFGPLAGLALASVMLVVTHHELHDKARTRRGEFHRTLSIYLDLVAMSLQAGRGHAEALPAAAAIGDGWAFTELRDAIEGARFSGTTSWAALGDLGTRLGITELTDLDSALQLANDDGAKVKATLVARAATLRAKRVADAEAGINRATESMKFALIVMVFAFLAYELYPAISRLVTG